MIHVLYCSEIVINQVPEVSVVSAENLTVARKVQDVVYASFLRTYLLENVKDCIYLVISSSENLDSKVSNSVY